MIIERIRSYSDKFARHAAQQHAPLVQLAFFAGCCLVVVLPTPLSAALADPLIAVSMGGIAALLWLVNRQAWVLFLAAGLVYTAIQFYAHDEAKLNPALERMSLVIEGTIIGLPRRKSSNVRFDFLVDHARYADGNAGADGELNLDAALGKLAAQRFRLNCYRCELDFAPGQTWKLTVRLKRPRGYASWGAFDYERYLFRHRIIATGYVRQNDFSQLLRQEQSNIHHVREQIRSRYSDIHPDTAGQGIFLALMLGDRSHLSPHHNQVLQAAGVSHLVAISGLHVGLVFALTLFLVRFLLWPFANLFLYVPRPIIALPAALLAAFAYAALAGFSVSTQRAIVMLSVFVLCRLLSRELNLLQVLLLAICVLLLIDPFSVLDTGFWLSCYAVAIIALAQIRLGSLNLVQLQPCLWVAMTPLTVGFFGQVSFVSPIVNLIVVPIFCLALVPAVLLILVIGFVGMHNIADWLANYLMQVFDLVFRGLEYVVDMPWSLYHSQAIAPWGILLLIFLLCSSLLKLRYMPLVLLLMGYLLWPKPSQFAADEFHLTVLDVGQGLALVVQAQDYVLVYDTGPAYSGGFSSAEAVLIPYLRQAGVHTIDDLIISHADNDHIGGLPAVLKNMRVKRVRTSRADQIPRSTSAIVSACARGDHWRVENLVFTMLGPEPETPDGSNNRSCVLRISNGEFTVLLSGDIEKPVERYMVRELGAALRADFLLVPHQGSQTSSTDEFLDAVRPRYAAVAAGYKNHYGHPHPQVMARYQRRDIRVGSTIDGGSIQYRVSGRKVQVLVYREISQRFWRH